MQVLHFYLVSILSCVKLALGGPTTLPTSTNVQLPQVSSKLQPQSSSSFPCSSKNNFQFVPQWSNRTNKAISTSNFSKKRITAVNGNTSDPFQSKNDIDPVSGVLPTPDKPGNLGSDSFKLYEGTVRVFRSIFNTWKPKSMESEDIAKTCVIPDDIVQTVNGSMAQLFEVQRNNTLIQLRNLAKTFYYMFDVKHMIGKFQQSKNLIVVIQSLIDRIENDIKTNNTAEYGESDLTSVVRNLKGLLENYTDGKYYNKDTMVNVRLMKGMMLMNLTENGLVNKELSELRSSLSKDFLKEIENNQYETDGSRIANNHVELMRNMIPGVFSLVHNHIKLLNILSTHNLNTNQKKNTQTANILFKDIMSTFIERFKNFRKMNEPDDSDSKIQKHVEEDSYLNIITELMEKLDTGNTDQENTKKPQELISMENAITAVLALAEKDESAQQWKDSTVFKLESVQENQSSEYYMTLLTHNFDVAYSLVGQFEKHFLDEIDKIKFISGGIEVFFL